MVMVGTPSETAKRLVELICKQPKPLTSCCCGVAVSSLWRDLLPKEVRQAVASMDLVRDFEGTLDVAVTEQAGPEVAAVGRSQQQRGNGRGRRRRGGQSRGGGQSSQQRPSGTSDSETPPPGCCSL